MSSLRQIKWYAKHKDSGVEWLGPIPDHWTTKRLKDCVSRLETGGTPESDRVEYWSADESGTPWVAIADMTKAFRVANPARRLTRQGLLSKHLPVLPCGTLLYSMYASLGKVAVLDVDAVVNQAILGIVPKEDVAARDFLRWWLTFMQGHVTMLSNSSTQDNLNAEKVRTMPVFIPPVGEQRGIAAFLDRETARIDALVAKKERLIELLEERRHAYISRLVTKGLDPGVSYMETGVEWLGAVPSSWKVAQLRYAITFQRGHDLPSDTREDGIVPVVSSAGISSAHSVAAAKAPGIVTGRYGTIGEFHLVLNDYWPLNTTLYSIDLHDNDPRFLRFMLKHLSPLFLLNAVKSAVPGVDRNDIHPILAAVPPLVEQRAIADALVAEDERVDKVLFKLRRAIDRLTERRTALIAAAVTGKIDVREQVA